MLAIISDIHDNLANLETFLKYAGKNKISEIFCLGDLTNNLTIKNLADGFEGKIYLVSGNADFFNEEYIKYFPKIKYYNKTGDVEIDNKKIAFTHCPYNAKEIAKSKKYDYIFYGHTHKPWQEKISETILLNPGTIAGTFGKATFAIWDEKKNKFYLILLDESRLFSLM